MAVVDFRVVGGARSTLFVSSSVVGQQLKIETLCLDRTGTGIVVRGLPRPGSVLDGLPGVGSGPGSVMRTGLRPSTGVVDVWSPSM